MQVRVAVRVCPATHATGSNQKTVGLKGAWGNFPVDALLDASQDLCFEEGVLPLVGTFLKNCSSILVCYGTASTGKTYTLEGISTPVRDQDGMVQRATATLLRQLSPVPRHRYQLSATYCALTAGTDASLVDLLRSSAAVASLKDSSASAALDKLTRHSVTSVDDMQQVLDLGRSIRSSLNRPCHTLLTLRLHGQTGSGEQLTTSMSFVELVAPEPRDSLGRPACSADPSMTRALSLAYSSLTAVCKALRPAATAGGASGAARLGRADGPATPSSARVPWRDSPLTRWLQDTLSGAKEMLLLATVAPGAEAAPDTLATLSFASKLRSSSRSDGLVVSASWEASTVPSALLAQQDRSASPGARARQRPSSPLPAPAPPATPTNATFSFPPSAPASSAYTTRDPATAPTAQPPPARLAQESRAHFHAPSTTSASPTASPVALITLRHSPSPPRLTQHSSQHSAHNMRLTQQGPARSQPVVSEAGSSGPGDEKERDQQSYREVKKAVLQAPGSSQLFAEMELESLLHNVTELREALSSSNQAAQLAQAEAAAHLESKHLLEHTVDELRYKLEAAHQAMADALQQRDDMEQQLQRKMRPDLLDARELEYQSQVALLDKQLAAAREECSAKQAALVSMTSEVASGKAEAEKLHKDRERLTLQVAQLKDNVQGQVANMGAEIARLRTASMEAVARCDEEERARRAAESQVAKLQAAADTATSLHAAVTQQLALLSSELEQAKHEASQLRKECSSLQGSKQEAERMTDNMTAQLQATIKALQQAQLDHSVALNKAQDAAKAATHASSTAEAELSSSKATVHRLRTQLAAMQATLEERQRLESIGARDLQDMEALLRELEQDMEVHLPLVWRSALEAELGDARLSTPQASPAARWRPVLRMLLTALQKQQDELGQHVELQDSLQHRIQALEARVMSSEEVSLSVAANQELRSQALAELKERQSQIRMLDEECRAARGEVEQLRTKLQHTEHALRTKLEEGEQQVRRQEGRVRELLNEREELMKSAEMATARQRQVASLEQLLSALWRELRGAQAALGPSGAGPADWSAAAGQLRGSPSRAPALDVVPEGDWTSPVKQEAALRVVSDFRLQAVRLTSELHSLRVEAAQLDNLAHRAASDLQHTSHQATLDLAACRTTYMAELEAHQQAAADSLSEVRALVAEKERAASQLTAQLGSEAAARAKLQQEYEKLLEEAARNLQTCSQLRDQVEQLEERARHAEQRSVELEAGLERMQAQLEEARTVRDVLQGQVSQAQEQASRLLKDAQTAEMAATAARQDASSASGQLAAAERRVCQLEVQLADKVQQAEVLNQRLERASTRSTDLASRLVLAEADARLKVQDLSSKLTALGEAGQKAAAESSQELAAARRQVQEQGKELVRLLAELEEVRAQRRDLAAKVDSAERAASEARARQHEADHAQRQLQAVTAERDTLSAQLHHLRGQQLQVHQELRTVQQEAEGYRSDLLRASTERNHLAAQLEANKLDHLVSATLSRGKASLRSSLSLLPSGPSPAPAATGGTGTAGTSDLLAPTSGQPGPMQPSSSLPVALQPQLWADGARTLGGESRGGGAAASQAVAAAAAAVSLQHGGAGLASSSLMLPSRRASPGSWRSESPSSLTSALLSGPSPAPVAALSSRLNTPSTQAKQ